MSRRHWLAATMVLVAAAVAAQPAEREVFTRPAHEGRRVDVCRLWSQGCGQPAADHFCELQHFERSIAFEVESDIGATAPTMTLEDRRLCDPAYCDGYLSITCAGPMPGTPGHVPGDAPYPPGVLPDDPPPPGAGTPATAS